MKKQFFSIFSVFFILALMSLTVACSKTDSSNVKTSGIYASFKVAGNSVGTATCTAQFQVGGVTGTFLDLNGGDTITCNNQPMLRSEFLGIVTYTASVSYSVGSTYLIQFTRGGEAPYQATVVLPDPILPFSPSLNQSIQKGSALSATWFRSSNNLDRMTVALSYTVNDKSYSYSQYNGPSETGSASFTPIQTSPEISAGAWAGQVRFTRSRSGQMPAGLSGAAAASQEVIIPIQLID